MVIVGISVPVDKHNGSNIVNLLYKTDRPNTCLVAQTIYILVEKTNAVLL